MESQEEPQELEGWIEGGEASAAQPAAAEQQLGQGWTDEWRDWNHWRWGWSSSRSYWNWSTSWEGADRNIEAGDSTSELRLGMIPGFLKIRGQQQLVLAMSLVVALGGA